MFGIAEHLNIPRQEQSRKRKTTPHMEGFRDDCDGSEIRHISPCIDRPERANHISYCIKRVGLLDYSSGRNAQFEQPPTHDRALRLGRVGYGGTCRNDPHSPSLRIKRGGDLRPQTRVGRLSTEQQRIIRLPHSLIILIKQKCVHLFIRHFFKTGFR